MEQQLLQSEIPAASRQPRGAVASKDAPGTAWGFRSWRSSTATSELVVQNGPVAAGAG